jgi:hypothetical protein
LSLRKFSLLFPVLLFYKLSRMVKLDAAVKALILPAKYKKAILELDVKPSVVQKVTQVYPLSGTVHS